MAEPTSRRDEADDDQQAEAGARRHLDEHLDEQLVDMLRPEVEAAEAVLTGDEDKDEAKTAEPAKPQTTDKDFFHALGGWGALLDIGLPWIAFLIVYAASDHDLRLALIVAVACGAAVAVLRILRKQPLRNVAGGFVGVLISAWVANRTGNAKDVYLPGFFTNLAYFALYSLTVLFRWPLFGVLYGVITQTGTAWRRDPAMLKGFTRATLVFAGLFALRLIVQVPLYLVDALNALGIAKVGMGLPLYALALWLAYAVLRGSLPPDKWEEARDHVTHLLRGNRK